MVSSLIAVGAGSFLLNVSNWFAKTFFCHFICLRPQKKTELWFIAVQGKPSRTIVDALAVFGVRFFAPSWFFCTDLWFFFLSLVRPYAFCSLLKYFLFLCFSFNLLSTCGRQFMENSTFLLCLLHLECQLVIMNNNRLFPSLVSHIFLHSNWLKRIISGLAPLQSLHFLSY